MRFLLFALFALIPGFSNASPPAPADIDLAIEQVDAPGPMNLLNFDDNAFDDDAFDAISPDEVGDFEQLRLQGASPDTLRLVGDGLFDGNFSLEPYVENRRKHEVGASGILQLSRMRFGEFERNKRLYRRWLDRHLRIRHGGVRSTA